MAPISCCSHVRMEGKRANDSTRRLAPKLQLIDDDDDDDYDKGLKETRLKICLYRYKLILT